VGRCWKEAAEFFLDTMVTDSKGRLVVSPSISPENRYRTASAWWRASPWGHPWIARLWTRCSAAS